MNINMRMERVKILRIWMGCRVKGEEIYFGGGVKCVKGENL